MHILFVIDPIHKLKAWKDSSVAMMQALAARGHELAWCEPADIRWKQGRVLIAHRPLSLAPAADLQSADWYRTGLAVDVPASHFDAVLMRKDPPFDLEYLYATHLLDVIEREGTPVFNPGRALRDHPEKLAITEFPDLIVPTLVSRNEDDLRAFYREFGEVVFKPLDGMGGMGVFRLNPNELNVGAIIELLTHDGSQSIMAQRFIPEIVDGDKRVLIIDGEPVPWCLARIPRSGETRGNLAAGGTGVARELSERDLQLANAVGERLAPRGLFLIGLDVIGSYVTEINVTSPTCFREIMDQTGFDVAARFAERLEARLQANGSAA